MSLNKIPNSTLLASDFQTQNQFSEVMQNTGSKQERNLITYIKNLLQEYIDERNKGIHSDKYKINKELLQKFRDDFYKFITDIVQNSGEKLDLDSILHEIFESGNVNKKIINEIIAVIKNVLQQLIKQKIQGKITNKISILDIKNTITKIEPYSLTDSEIKHLLETTLTDTNPIIQSIKNELGDNYTNYKESLFKMFKKQIIDDNEKRRFLEKQEQKKSKNIIFDKFSLRHKIDASIEKRIDSLCNRIIILIGHSFLERTFIHFKKILNFMISIPKKIIKAVSKCFHTMSRMIFSATFGLITNVVLKPLHFIISKTSSVLMGITKGIFKTVKNIVKRTNAHFLLLTPMGMYALGFLLGFIWSKVKKLLPDISFSIDGVIKFFKNIIEDILIFYHDMIDSINNVINESKKLSETKQDFFNFIKTWKEEGLQEAFKETKIYKLWKEITDSPVFKIASTLYDLVAGFLKWTIQHPMLSGFLFSVAEGWKGYKILRSFYRRTISPYKGNILGFIGGMFAGEATYAVTEGLIGMFGKADAEKAIWSFKNSKSKLLKSMELGRKNKDVFKINPKTNQKYLAVTQYIDERLYKIDKLYRDLELLNDLKEKYEGFGNIINNNLRNSAPNLINSIFNLGYSEAKFESKSLDEQFIYLYNILDTEVSRITHLQRALNTATTETVDKVLSTIIDDNLKITDTRSANVKKVLSQWESLEDVTAIQLDQIVRSSAHTYANSSKEERLQIMQGIINAISDKRDMFINNKANYNTLTKLFNLNYLKNGETIMLSDLLFEYKKQNLLGDHRDSIWNPFDREVDSKKILTNILGRGMTTSQKEETIEQMVTFASKEQILQIEKLIESVRNGQKSANELTPEIEKLRNEIFKQRHKNVNHNVILATNDLYELSEKMNNDCSDYLLSCYEFIHDYQIDGELKSQVNSCNDELNKLKTKINKRPQIINKE